VIRLSLYVKEMAWVLYGSNTILFYQSVTASPSRRAKHSTTSSGRSMTTNKAAKEEAA